MSEWNLPWDGGCRCGQVRLTDQRAAASTMACHCTGCQRMTSKRLLAERRRSRARGSR